MTRTPGGADVRLDSWKAIAEYLGRDVATVRRWEKSAGLPVRRVAGLSAANATTHMAGRLLWLSPTGQLQRTFSFDDTVSFTGENCGGPWAITDYRLAERGATLRLAAPAHHMQWWPSVVTVLNARWQREGTFVNAGWVEYLQWLTPDRLLIVGSPTPATAAWWRCWIRRR